MEARASGEMTLRWYNPGTGEFVGEPIRIEGGAEIEPGGVPSNPEEDWVALIQK